MSGRKRKIRRGYVRERQQFASAVTQIDATAALPEMTPDGLLRREYAWRKADFISEVLVPASIAGAYGVMGASWGAIAAVALRVSDVPAAAIFGGIVCGSAAFVVVTRRQLDSLWTIEEYGEEEISVAGPPPAPPPREPHVLAINSYQGQQNQARDQRNRRRSELIQFVRRCYISGTSWDVHKKFLANRAAWAELRDLMIKLGYARWLNERAHNQGWEMTAPLAETLAAVSEND